MTAKALLERMAPVLIDGISVSALLGLVDVSIKSSLSDETDTETVVEADDAVGAGMKLLLVSCSVWFQEGCRIFLSYFMNRILSVDHFVCVRVRVRARARACAGARACACACVCVYIALFECLKCCKTLTIHLSVLMQVIGLCSHFFVIMLCMINESFLLQIKTLNFVTN